MTLQPGARLGTYEIVDLLGVGGMGEVYRATDRKLGRAVAIKVLPSEFASDPSRVTRFEREARMLAAVNHPTIAAIYGAEEDGATRYIVMELVEGETLAQRLSTGPLAVTDALRAASQVAEALEVAHEKGVIHRDLKPANIKITPEGKVKVLDFGLAKAMELPFAGDMSRSPTLVMSDSRPGEIVGTPEFMSPEQARGKETDRRTDIWAFGCILFESLSGKRAFTGETVPDAVGAILHLEPDWASLPPRTPERIRELLRLCLEKDPGRRLRDAGDARLEIEAALAGISGSGALAPARTAGGWSLAAAVAAGIAVAFGAYLVLKPKPARHGAEPTPTPAVRQLAVLPFRNLTTTADGDLWGVALADTVSAKLANVDGLQVVTPRAPSGPEDSTDTSLSSIARRLGANTLVEGSLQREHESFRITFRLIDAAGTQIAAGALDGKELFDLQDRIAANIVEVLELKPALQRTPTPSGLDTPALQERYLQALGLLQRYDKLESVQKALAILEKLAEEKPNSALVRTALARAELSMYSLTSDVAWAKKAVDAGFAARALDPTLPEVDVTVGDTLRVTGRSREAVDAYRRALAARPGDVFALIGLGRAAAAAGDPATSEAAFKQAMELQPSWSVFNSVASHYYGLGLYTQAAALFRRAAQTAPDSSWARSNVGGAEAMRCDFPAAIEEFRTALKIDPKNASAVSNLGMTQLWAGRAADAVTALERAAADTPDDYKIWGNLGSAYAEIPGASEKAKKALERSIALAREQLKLNAADPEALSYLATGLAATGRSAEAEAPMREALRLEKSDPNVFADAASVAALAGRDSEALDYLSKAVAAGYCPSILTFRPEFTRLRDNPDFRAIVTAPQKAAGG
ncbi:MAG TPA: protein kinase [Thermoanaerobaculia bacterium]|nr:protein kinase [Thermoanaerobaculia bacterium]